MAEVHAHGQAHSTSHSEPEHGAGGESGHDRAGMKDPVCGMSVTRESPHRQQHGGDTYYFCSGRCLSKFTADPARYVGPHDGHRHEVAVAPPAPAAP